MKAAELLVRCLENEGVRFVFGVPGEEVLEIMDALSRSSIRFIVTRHEQGAAFMADAYGRLTGRAGVCLATLGPGATNLTTGIADAQLDFAPLVAITGQTGLERLHKESHQFVDVVKIFEAVTQWNIRVHRPETIPEVVRKAFKVAEQEKPGAAHIEITTDLQEAEVREDVGPLTPRRARRPSPDRTALQHAADVIARSRFPLILAGSSAVRKPEAAMELRRFARRFGIPVTHTFMGKGVLSDYDPLSLMPVGMPGAIDLCTSGLCLADTVICVGYDQIEYHSQRWNPRADKRIVHIDYTPSEVDRFYRPEVEVVADIRESLETLGSILRYQPSRRTQEMVEHLSTLVAQERGSVPEDGFPVKPLRLVHEMRKVLGEEDILVSDVGAHKLWIGRYFPAHLPNTVLISNGYSAMGFGLPAGLAAKLVYPDRRVLVAAGDGGFLMTCHELETAVRLGLGLVIVVWVDNAYGLIKWKQQTESKAPFGVDFGNPDFAQLARSFGAVGYELGPEDDVGRVLEEAFRRGRPAVVSVAVEEQENLRLTERLRSFPCPAEEDCLRPR
jgi:acetolactate synthase-1/2/3 large subunit